MKSTDYYNGFADGFLACVFVIVAIFLIMVLTSCAVYPEPEPVEWKPKHTGTYVECDTIVNGDTLYYFKKL